MTFADLIGKLRTKLDDTVQPYFWDSTELLGYLIRACEMFVSTVYGGRLLYEVDLSDGDYTADVSGRPNVVVELVAVSFGTDILEENDLVTYSASPTGSPVYYKQSTDRNTVYIYPATNKDGTLKCSYRASISADYITSDTEDVPLNSEHQAHLLEGAAALAYGKRDSEAYDEKQMAQNFQTFSALMEQAKRDVMRTQVIRTLRMNRGLF